MTGQDQTLKGILWAVSAVCTAGCLLAVPKYAAPDLPAVQITALRYLAGVAAISPFFAAERMARRGGASWPFLAGGASVARLHVLRAVLAVTRLTCLFYAVTHMPFANAQAIALTNNVFMIVFATLLLGEKVRPATAFAAAICFAGGIIAAEPEFGSSSLLNSGAVAALAGAAIWGIESMVIKVTATRDSIAGIIFTVNAVAAMLVIVPGVIWWQPIALEQWAILALMGPLAVATQSANIKAFRLADANIVAPFRYASVVVAVALGWFVFAEWPSAAAFFGMALILAGGLMLTRTISARRITMA